MLARRVALSLVLLVLALSSCKRKPTIPPDVIARVNDRMLTLADFKRYLERNAGTDLAGLPSEVASAILDQFVEEIIVSAHEGDMDPVSLKRDEMRRERLVANLSAEVPEPSASALQEYYDQHQAEFRSGEEVRVRQILVNDENLANEIVKKLQAGTPFGDLSAQYSRAPNAKRGGEIGFVSRGDLPKMFEEEIFRLRAGQTSGVLRTDTSFHIFQVDERRPAGILDFASATPIIQTRLREEAVRARLDAIKARSRREMKIAILTRRLPFRYSGGLPKAEDE